MAIYAADQVGRDLHALGDVAHAQRLGEDTLVRARRVLGDDSHFTIDTANNFAADLHVLGEHEAARQLSEDTFAWARRVFGDNHPRGRQPRIGPTRLGGGREGRAELSLPGENGAGYLASLPTQSP